MALCSDGLVLVWEGGEPGQGGLDLGEGSFTGTTSDIKRVSVHILSR